MTQAEFWEAMKAYRDEKTADRRHLGELTRGLAARVANLLIKHPIKRIEDYWPMPWDEKDTAEDIAAGLKQMSREERKTLALRYKEQTDQYFKNDGIRNDSSQPQDDLQLGHHRVGEGCEDR